ncbi:Glucokinase [Sterolibacterium denitrificans]|uniref:Glucokinase n=1 Tax=Sterolibacterium denitrificans TaxID=157592 RepID=A0A7Z7MUQ0_9PROT|nr:glucokinase [Sterolibacterium denitrificans]SMB23937.1 Glucokinase [Sterolibacterium denitrificans]
MILCGDIGGTKTLLALADKAADGRLRIHFQRRYLARDYPDFAAPFADFIAAAAAAGQPPHTIRSGCLAVAGPIETQGRSARLTNLPWRIDADALAAQQACGPLRLVNDFVAAAAGIAALDDDALVTLQAGQPLDHAPRVIVGAGTGLGTASLVWQNDGQGRGRYRILPGEGGHCAFAPTDAEQAALWYWLAARLPSGRVTAEEVISGRGLLAIHDFLRTQHAADAADPRAAADPAAAISALAATAPHSLARRALDLFCRAYGAFAGDLALLLLARGGVYIAGGIAAQILPLLRSGPFLAAFNAKAEHARLAALMPLHVVTDPDLGLKGAALLALSPDDD